ncbi:RNA 2'-phosphotransferase [Desertivirga brevis]|uniref:RNA 2'-phosphotransferase n=1 Tax=Desertivirga brevis TaxID=2810310 RepID=UPI001A96843E|nr:RNA 2'-phosphotransferase [Pedobacter sp. SYSU D00873]
MSNRNDEIKISKFLSLVLRHQPETIGIELDENGWTEIDVLIEKSAKKGILINHHLLKHIVDTNSKKRFAINEAGNKIRANQGHSVEVELGYTAQEPPELLYHGTGQKSVEEIMRSGLDKRSRHHVHLSSDIKTAIDVGSRHGKPFVFEVLAGQMHRDKFEFFLSENKVWLTSHVPVRYLKEKH